MKLKVVTINIAGVQFDWFEKRRDALVNELKALSPDVVFLQETTVIPHRNYDQSLDIGTGIGLNSLAFTSYGNLHEYESPRLGGLAILSRWPFKQVQNRKLPPGMIDQYGARAALIGVIQVEGQDVLLGTTHLCFRAEESDVRLKQTEEFLKFIHLYQMCPFTVVGGDFNAIIDEPAIQRVSDSYQDAFLSLHPDDEGITWSRENKLVRSVRSDRRIDYIFCSKNLGVEKAEVILNEEKPIFPSDHFGVMAELLEST